MTCHGHVAGHYDGTVANQREHLLTQANVAPVDENGGTVGIVGTIAFAVASIVCWIMLDRLTGTGYRDWLWICPPLSPSLGLTTQSNNESSIEMVSKTGSGSSIPRCFSTTSE